MDHSLNIKKREIVFLLLLGISPHFFNGFYNSWLINWPALFWCIEIFTWVIIPLTIYFYAKRKDLFTKRDVGFHNQIFNSRGLFFIILLTPITFLIINYIDLAAIDTAQYLFPTNYLHVETFDYLMLIPISGIFKYLAFLFFAFSAGFVEEFYYRGIMSLFFRKSFLSSLLFIMISSGIWAVVHWERGVCDIFSVFILGLAFSALYRFYNNIYPLLISHVFLDIVRNIAFILPQSWVPGG